MAIDGGRGGGERRRRRRKRQLREFTLHSLGLGGKGSEGAMLCLECKRVVGSNPLRAALASFCCVYVCCATVLLLTCVVLCVMLH